MIAKLVTHAPTREAGDRRAGRRARCLRDRRHPPQHSVPLGADGASALARGRALDRLHRRGISRRLPCRIAPRGRARAGAGRGRGGHRSRAGRAQAADFRPDGRPRGDARAPARRLARRRPNAGSRVQRATNGDASTVAFCRATAERTRRTCCESDWKPGDPLWSGTVDGEPVAVQVRPCRTASTLCLSRRRGRAYVYTESEAG